MILEPFTFDFGICFGTFTCSSIGHVGILRAHILSKCHHHSVSAAQRLLQEKEVSVTRLGMVVPCWVWVMGGSEKPVCPCSLTHELKAGQWYLWPFSGQLHTNDPTPGFDHMYLSPVVNGVRDSPPFFLSGLKPNLLKLYFMFHSHHGPTRPVKDSGEHRATPAL